MLHGLFLGRFYLNKFLLKQPKLQHFRPQTKQTQFCLKRKFVFFSRNFQMTDFFLQSADDTNKRFLSAHQPYATLLTGYVTAFMFLKWKLQFNSKSQTFCVKSEGFWSLCQRIWLAFFRSVVNISDNLSVSEDGYVYKKQQHFQHKFSLKEISFSMLPSLFTPKPFSGLSL